jgi:hypothetical protein
MFSKGVYSPEQLNILISALNERCLAKGLTSTPDWETVARQLLELCEGGATPPEALTLGRPPRIALPIR